MELPRLVTALSDAAAYPSSLKVQSVEVRQSHISVVFLAGPYAYKVKKPLALGFLDYGTLERRRHFCEQEVILNRRLAPAVYLGVVPVTSDGTGLRMEGSGTVVEWAVKMARLPDEATLRARLLRGELDMEPLEALARRIAEFHARAEAGPAIADCGRFAIVAENARENFHESTSQVGTTLSRSVFERLQERTESTLAELRPIIERRAARGVPRDGHGDLRLDHVYLLPDQPPPADQAIIDCIEFNERLRYGDPVADIAFPVMDLLRHGRRDLARSFADVYFAATGDDEGRALLTFYTAYRSSVRGKVEGMKLSEPEVSAPERAAALARSRAHWLLALHELEEPQQRPCLVLVGGLPGTGKSILARALAETAGFSVIRSDVVRKELAGTDPDSGEKSPYKEGIYSPEWTTRTYAECLRRADARLFEGDRVLVDATFRTNSNRRTFLDAADSWGVPARLLVCRANSELVRGRLEGRRDDASDADWSVYLQSASRWEEPSSDVATLTREIATSGSLAESLAQSLDLLREAGLWN
jgi:aminoglycoside phosphotransferase family enzyme/predicted kinase